MHLLLALLNSKYTVPFSYFFFFHEKNFLTILNIIAHFFRPVNEIIDKDSLTFCPLNFSAPFVIFFRL
ncbi:hypothetical protein C1645_767259 [Glomus cerebriforme]|uniref:Uncharacterized protein n=1 Tax=Glomus cerebriforme TaxID=658196 RepID=A0A397T2G4_9GLOM|nr:hypothetical protein C1645_767259 [Glomus cerebriforme]